MNRGYPALADKPAVAAGARR